jgi:hypothetical protein
VGDEQRLRELREKEARLRELEQTDDVGVRLDALREDIRLAKAELDEAIADAQKRGRRLEGDQPSP